MYYKLGQLCFITNQGKRCYKLGHLLQIRATVITKQGSYDKLGQNVLQTGAGIANQGNFYKLGHNTCYSIIYFFLNNSFFECIYFSEYDIFIFLFVFWESNRPSIKYVRNQGNGGGSYKMLTDAYRGREVSRFMCTYALTLSFFMFLSYGGLVTV